MSDQMQAAATVRAPSATAVREELRDILASPRFQNCPRIRAFLSFVVEETLAGRGDRLKEHTIAQAVFDKDESFDPKESSLVRVEAGRLRARLRGYYRNEGKADSLRLEIPKGGYQPRFLYLATAEETRAGGEASDRNTLGRPLGAWPRALTRSVAFIFLAVTSVAILVAMLILVEVSWAAGGEFNGQTCDRKQARHRRAATRSFGRLERDRAFRRRLGPGDCGRAHAVQRSLGAAAECGRSLGGKKAAISSNRGGRGVSISCWRAMCARIRICSG